MKLFEATPFKIQVGINEEERLSRARGMAKAEKESKVLAEMDDFYSGKATDNTNNYDRKELNSFMELS